jgi:predicted transcriptional regulator
MTTLYSLALEGLEIEELLIESLGEITPDIQEKMDALLESGPDKLESAAAVVRQLQASAKIAEEESDRLRERAKTFEAQAEKLKERMGFALDRAFGGKIKTAKWTIYMQKNADRTVADLVPGVTAEMLHEERPDLVRVKMELDRVKAVALYKDPVTRAQLPELLLFEEKTGERSIRIK